MLHADSADSPQQDLLAHDPSYRWYKELTRYHWFVFTVAALGWLFDCLDQQLFILARPAAMDELLKGFVDPQQRTMLQLKTDYGDMATSVFILGWASGGLIFGMLGDRIGRAKTMMITILLYSLFTGLSALSRNVYDFAAYRFLTGLGVGGEFAVGVALLAETMPTRARTYALASLQALSAFGNISAALINLTLGIAEEGLPYSPWRIMFCVGAIPALLTLVIRRRLKEPEVWQQASHAGAVTKQLGSYRELFTHPTWRKHAILGLLLACSGVIGLWAVGFYSPDLIRQVQTKPITAEVYQAETASAQTAGDSTRVEQLEMLQETPPAKVGNLSSELQALKADVDKKIRSKLVVYQSLTSIAINFGAFFGMFGFGALSQRIGRKPTFAIALVAAFIATASVFWVLTEMWQIFVLVPIMGFCQLSLFGGYAIYFPELFPTHLRSTGTSFCYNVGRFVAAAGPIIKSRLTQYFSVYGDDSIRYAGVTMCAVFFIGLFVLPFLPETRGKPLPE